VVADPAVRPKLLLSILIELKEKCGIAPLRWTQAERVVTLGNPQRSGVACETRPHGRGTSSVSRHNLRLDGALRAGFACVAIGIADGWVFIAVGVAAIAVSLVRLHVILDRRRTGVGPKPLPLDRAAARKD
jgi:hypothetical protein